MHLDDGTRRDLAEFLARRYPTPEARAALAGSAGLSVHGVPGPSVEGWTVLLQRAEQTKRVARLIDAACAGAPDDANLAEVRRVLTERSGPPLKAVALGIAGFALVGLLGLVLWPSTPEPAPSGPAANVTAPDVTPTTGPAAVEPAPAPDSTEKSASEPAPAPVEPAPPASTPAPAAPEPAVAPPPEKPAEKAVPEKVVASAASTATDKPDSGRRAIPSACRGTPGQLVGYWYARSAPGSAGEVISLPAAVNIRTDYPHAENRFARSGKVLCSVSAGTRQRLSQAPIPVAGGAWWVPVLGGDLE